MNDLNAHLIRALLVQSLDNGFKRALHIRLDHKIQGLGLLVVRAS